MTRSSGEQFSFRFDPAYRALGRLFMITENSAYVRVGDGAFTARFGPWRVHTALSNIAAVSISGPYRMVKTAGPARLSVADRGLTFASNASSGVCVQFREPVRGLDPFGLLRHPNLTVTVADVAGLTRLLQSG
jgi:hypothetical protein